MAEREITTHSDRIGFLRSSPVCSALSLALLEMRRPQKPKDIRERAKGIIATWDSAGFVSGSTTDRVLSLGLRELREIGIIGRRGHKLGFTETGLRAVEDCAQPVPVISYL